VTQWCFGPPLVDRGFALTGGVCELAQQANANVQSESSYGNGQMAKKEVATVLTHAACNMARGTWKGGYDISGHVFILVLGSGMLWFEMLPFFAATWKGLGVGRIVKTAAGRVVRVGVVQDELAAAVPGQTMRSVNDATMNVADNLRSAAKEQMEQHPRVQQTVESGVRSARGLKHYAAFMALATAVLSWWMLLMTAAFFHTWFEKLTGLLLSFGALWVMYYLPRGSAIVREVLGMPGV
jgi:hypothetical protein